MNAYRRQGDLHFIFIAKQGYGEIGVQKIDGPRVWYRTPEAVSDGEFDAWVSGFAAARDKGWGVVI